MNRKEKATFVHATLEQLFPDPPIPLDHFDPFSLLIAVLLSAQCTDAVVNQVTPALFKAAPNPLAMSRLSPAQILELIKRCGLAPTKSRHIHQLAHMLLNDFAGQVPASFTELERLPGVGHKTASVVMSHAFKVPAFPVDTHIHRLAARWGLSAGANVVKTEADLKKLFPSASWEKLHLQFIYFGRKYCPARGHDPALCPICSVVG